MAIIFFVKARKKHLDELSISIEMNNEFIEIGVV